jgi:lipid-binding SYLF domain-containing protein
MEKMARARGFISACLILGCAFFSCGPAFAVSDEGVNLKPKTPEEWRTYLRFRRDETMEELYRLKPEAKFVVQRAHGYAVFTNFSMKILLVGTGNGRGLVHDNKTGKETFMRMLQAGVGFGAGVKDFRAVFIFDDRLVMENFINSGWSFGGGADAAVTAEETEGAATSGAIDVAPGVRVYQLTKNGLALSATVNGTKYWIDKDVNEE